MYLKEIYDPVRDEWHERDLPVEGVVPGDVNGVFLRIGPNPFYPPTGDYHLVKPLPVSLCCPEHCTLSMARSSSPSAQFQ